jgi:UDP-glucose 4-epimerase
MKILITGGLGFIGGRLSKKLSPEHEVTISSRKYPADQELKCHGGVRYVEHQQLFSPEKFPKETDAVIHLAAMNEWDSVKFPSEAIRVNIDETRQILENSIGSGVKQFIYFSTAHIYGSPLTGNISESSLPVPQHPYAITHKAAEDYVIAATLQKKIKGVIIRLSNAFGSPVSANVNRWTLLANDLCRQAVEKNQLVLTSNGCQYRDFVCLTDVENIIGNMIADPVALNYGLYNLGSGKSMRVLDMAGMIASAGEDILGKKINIELPSGAVASREPELFYSVERLRSDHFNLQNHFRKEIGELLTFCKKSFSKHD